MTGDNDGRPEGGAGGGRAGEGPGGVDGAFTLALVEALDEERLEGCVARGDVDRVMDGDASARALAETHAAGCELCHEALALFDAVTGGEGASIVAEAGRRGAQGERAELQVVGSAPRGQGADAARRGRTSVRWGRLLALAAAGLLAGGAALLLSRPADGPLTPKGGPDGDGVEVVGVHGGEDAADALHVAVMRDGVAFRASAGARVVEGDVLRLFHSSRAPGFLLVVNVDAAYERTVLLPHEGERSAPIAAGAEVALPGGALVGEGSGCEWLIAVFSDAPLAVDAVDAAIAEARAVGDPGACELRVAVPGARTVAVVPVRR